ncbi:LysM peptidoglycan-binding domain-containing protein [Vibrio sp. VPAP30]|uniref:LysM peptidoglycan-binding domain-containing protein n=1 Tax=Vibrio sp. VPAP30 TaxID=1647102 RepID=UPI0006760097|nr:LysM domain-containing protein [Vibrio sp. VPAP30]
MVRIWRGLRVAMLLTVGNLVSGQAEPLSIKPDAPDIYTVMKEDTLWDISALYLDSPWKWPLLWQINSNIANPDLIYPGDQLALLWREGHPTLSLKSVVRLAPSIVKRDKPAILALNPQYIIPYLEHNLILENEAFVECSRVMGNSLGTQLIDGHDVIYISGDQVAQEWGIYRLMNQFKRGDKTAQVIKRIAHAQLVASNDLFSTLKLVQQSQEILFDDIALPLSETSTLVYKAIFSPIPAQLSLVKILGSVDDTHYVGKNQAVVLNRGQHDGVQQGNVFALLRPAADLPERKQARGEVVQLPDKLVGHLMVVRPYQYFSVAIVTEASEAVSKKTKLQPPRD